ncbi:MAG: transglutaminase-like domain-containing protein [Paludibacter sp.]|nr:transglutaminase-like domain-containing protein [Paludibacter sp.]MDD4199209.1 transglutaminase-like domain-containing protein [Paludibacter sp.]MDD4428757.1 transglutaminase-like domain-containing protein [Paludibacter sp.]
MHYPESTEVNIKTYHQVVELSGEKEKGIITRKWTVKNLRAVNNERFAPSLDTQNPKVYAVPRTFIYENTKGELTNAEHICKWQQELNIGRDELSPATKNTISELIKDATTDKEKVKILYDYLGSITRYESIQLGIGGFQPIPAAKVCRTGFGDCKGLSNLLKAMLNQVNIPANYAIIRMNEQEKDLADDFTAFIRTNHVILQVPLPGDTLWLECTNTKIPFGFIHNQIAGHNVLVTTKNGGYMTRLPDYPDSLNIENNQMHIKLNADGSAKVQVEKNWNVKIYDNVYHLITAKTNEVNDYLRKEISLPHATVSQVKLEDNKSVLPSLKATYEWTTPLFGSKTTNRLLIPVNAMRYTINRLKKGQRENNIQITTGWKDTDQIYIEIPEGYKIESLPSHINHTCAFGNFEFLVLNIGNQILINQSVVIKSGHYDASLYPDFVDFIEKITEMYQNRIILRKSTAS